MTPEQFAASLSERLRSRGVHALPEEVRSFTAGIGQQLAALRFGHAPAC